jgi:hypothetical protein
MYTQADDWTVTYKGQTRPLVREGAPQRQDNKFQTQTLEKEGISGHVMGGFVSVYARSLS